jgi:DNA-binding transcriptional regulator YhcF (GntR family)
MPPKPPRVLGAQINRPTAPGSFVQTERRAHEAWASLIAKSPTAAMVMHHLVARMGHQNAVVISQKTLAKLLGCHPDTVKRAVADLVRDRWVQVVQVGGRGTVNAYVVNDTVAWGQSRDQRPTLSVFSAQVVADAEDQTAAVLEAKSLRRLPLIYPPEEALPMGPGEPGAQMLLDGMEPVLEGNRGDRQDD